MIRPHSKAAPAPIVTANTARFLAVLALSVAFVPLLTADGFEKWRPIFSMRGLGVDLGFASEAFLLGSGKTELEALLGGVAGKRGYYREAAGARADPSSAVGEFDSAIADIWVRATQYFEGGSGLRASLFLRAGSVLNLSAEGSEPLIFASALPERRGALEAGAGLALGYSDFRQARSGAQDLGTRAELAYEWSWERYADVPGGGPLSEATAEILAFIPLLDGEKASLVLGGHALASALLGSAPEHRLSALGGNRYYRYEGLGGLVRGLPDGYGDGRLKAAGNLDARLALPALWQGRIRPGAKLFLDLGVAGGLDGSDAFFLATAGAAATAKIVFMTFNFGAVMDLREGSAALYFSIGSHFPKR